MGHHHDVLQDLREPTRSLRKAIPDTWSGFVALHTGAMADGEVPTRLKEAAALAISVAKRWRRRPAPPRERWPSCWALPS